MKIFPIYLLLINAAAFVLMLADRVKARNNLWRIPERVLMLSAALGGSIGALLGMKAWRHKTKHNSFRFGIPAILALQILIPLGLWVYFTFIR